MMSVYRVIKQKELHVHSGKHYVLCKYSLLKTTKVSCLYVESKIFKILKTCTVINPQGYGLNSAFSYM